jgi:copper chaperone NosL
MVMICCLAACDSGGKPRPINIVWTEDSCDVCRMAVSDRKFAAELVKSDGTYKAYDDIGCLVDMARKSAPIPRSAMYVLDFDAGGWLDAEAAHYLYSPDLPTPMSYGIGAFASAQAALEASKQWNGKVLDWPGLLKEFKP